MRENMSRLVEQLKTNSDCGYTKLQWTSGECSLNNNSVLIAETISDTGCDSQPIDLSCQMSKLEVRKLV